MDVGPPALGLTVGGEPPLTSAAGKRQVLAGADPRAPARTGDHPMRLVPHLYFKGDCEAALAFYAECGLGAVLSLRRYADTPMADRDGGAWRDKVVHAVFEGPDLRFFAGDGPDSEQMKGCALLIECDDDTAAAAVLFDALSAGGRVTVPFKRQFWGASYGNFTDRFGVQWAVNSEDSPRRP
jgi:PhnB protein